MYSHQKYISYLSLWLKKTLMIIKVKFFDRGKWVSWFYIQQSINFLVRIDSIGSVILISYINYAI